MDVFKESAATGLPYQVLHAIGVGPGAHIASLPGNENSNCLVTDGASTYVVKNLRAHSPANTELEGVYRHRLADAGLPALPYLPLDGGNCVLSLPEGNFVATDYIEGAMAIPTEQLVAEAAGLLARVHSLPTEGLPQRAAWYRKEYIPESLELIDGRYDDAKAAFRAQRASYPDFWAGGFPAGIIHGDLQEDNLITNDAGTITSILDWEEAMVGPLLLDIAHSVQQLSFERGVCNPKLFYAFMAGYQAVRPLTEIEKGAFEPALRYTMLVLSVWAHIKKSRGEMGDDLFQRLGNYYRADYTVPALPA